LEQNTFTFQSNVKQDWVDYNGHMNDAAYAQVFSLAVDAFMDFIGLAEATREKHAYTIFTLETHLCYLQEANEGESLQVSVQLLDVDDKRLHVFFAMKNIDGDIIATSEQMLMGIDTKEGKAASFPSEIAVTIEKLFQADEKLEHPKQVGRKIGIRRR
jgi:acyl-CoA thioester hydrolase